MEKVNEGHYHEIMDRVHIINSMIDDFLIDHPGMTKAMNVMCETAQFSLSSVSEEASEEQEMILK